MKAIKLFNLSNGNCSFSEGSIPDLERIQSDYFFIQSNIEAYQLVPHPAPRIQYVITLKGKLKFTVTDGTSFIIEPGIILVAKDIDGPGHSWELIEGTVWERIYIVPPSDAPDHFIPADK